MKFSFLIALFDGRKIYKELIKFNLINLITMIYGSITELIGKTPMVEISGIEGQNCSEGGVVQSRRKCQGSVDFALK